MDEEIDLRPYIALLMHSWRQIVGSSLVIALIALLVSFLLPKQYEATASLAIVRSRTDITFDPRIVDVAETDFVRADAASRRQALIALVSNNNVALSVLQELADTLPIEKRSANDLLLMIDAANEGDLINITVRSSEPQLAANIANSWSQHYQETVNNLYGATGNMSLDSLSVQVQSASESYDLAQERLETYIGTNRILTLEGEIKTQQNRRDAFLGAQVAVEVEPINLQTNTNVEILADYYKTLAETELWLADAMTLRDLVASGQGSAAANLGNILALIALQNRVFGGSATFDLHVDVSQGVWEPIQLNDIEAIITTIEKRQSMLLTQVEAATTVWIEQRPQEISFPDEHPLNLSIVDVEQKIQLLQADLESQQAQQRELIMDRDQAWDTYQALARKLTEEGIAAQTIGTEVRLAEIAIPPKRAINVRGIYIAAAAGITGMIFAILVILVKEWWDQYLSKNE